MKDDTVVAHHQSEARQSHLDTQIYIFVPVLKRFIKAPEAQKRLTTNYTARGAHGISFTVSTLRDALPAFMRVLGVAIEVKENPRMIEKACPHVDLNVADQSNLSGSMKQVDHRLDPT